MNEAEISTTDLGKAPDPPLLDSTPLLGHALDMGRDPSDFFVRKYKEHGPVFRIKVLNNQYTVLAGPKANLFMSRHSKEFLRSKEFWQGLVDEFGADRLLPAEDGESHAELRKVMKAGFSRSTLKGRYQELIDVTEGILEREWRPGTEVAVVNAMQRMVTEQLGQIVANQSPGDYVEDIRLFIKRILNVRITKQRPGLLMHLPDYKRAKARFFELGQAIIDNHQTDPDHPTIFLDDVLAAAGEGVFTKADLMGVVLSPYVAGLDTVANTTASFVYAVLKHPHVLERLTAEANAVFATGVPTPQTLKRDMPVTYGAFMETLRLYPIAAAAMRNANKDFVYEGYRIYEGEPLYMATAVSHFLPDFYPDPYTFDIDRYQKPRNEHRQPGAFAPFGLGPHTCLGAGLAEVLIMLSMATLFHRLRLELSPPDYTLKIDVAPTPGPEMKFKVRVAKRRNHSDTIQPLAIQTPQKEFH